MLRLDNVYIISYLPDEPVLRAKRKEIHQQQLDYWTSRANVVVYAQNYGEGDYDSRVRYIKHPGRHVRDIDRPGPARNVLLKEFYESDNDFGLFLDDDIVLYSGEKYMDSDQILELLRSSNLLETPVSIFEPLNPTQMPFGALYQEKADTFANNLWFKRKGNISGQSVFVKNLKKHNNTELYYRDTFDENGNIVMGEDVLFGLDGIRQGIFSYTLLNCVRKDMAFTKSTWATDESRKEAFANLKNILIQEGVGVKGVKQNLDWAGFMNTHFVPKEVLTQK